jgi:hypothetical protein
MEYNEFEESMRRRLFSALKVALNFVYSTAGFWGLALVLMWFLSPPGVLVFIPPQQEVQTSNPKVAVHTRLTDEVEAWKIQRTLRLVREMGAPWVVEYFPWAYIEPSQGQFMWEHSDLVINHAQSQGLKIIARLGMVPAWARPDPEDQETTFTYLDQNHFDDFANYVKAFLNRYQSNVQHIIIWNEPNLSFEWGYRQVDPAGYTNLLRTVYPVAHEINSDVVILAGALAPTLEPPGSPAGLNDLLYLQQMYAAEAAHYFDALAVHAYGLAFQPDFPPDETIINFRRVELLREIMVRNGDEEKQVYITEAGWNDHPRWLWAVSPGERVRYTLDAYSWAEEHWSWCPVLAVWMFRTPVKLHNYQDYYAFITPEFQARPIYEAVKQYTGNAD